jgi:predicted nucleic acid-binding protein
MNVLIDTSVWVDHFRNRNEALVNLISLDKALTHPMVIIELACGTPPSPRAQTLRDIGLLLPAKQCTSEEVLDFIERERLYGLGCGAVDISLLASTIVTPGALLWTLDKRLAKLAGRFSVEYKPEHH